MPVSEIDDIFAAKGKQKAKPPPPVPSSSSLPDKKKSKKKKKKRDSTDKPADQGSLDKPPSQKKRPAPETVVDPSTQILAAKRPRTEPPSNVRTGKTVKAEGDKGKKDEDKFKDSRGSGPRESLHLHKINRAKTNTRV